MSEAMPDDDTGRKTWKSIYLDSKITNDRAMVGSGFTIVVVVLGVSD